MQSIVQRDLLRRLIRLLDDPSAEAEPMDFRIPARNYVCQERLDAELKCVFRRAPLLLAHSSELPDKGSFIRNEFAGLPLLAVRDERNRVRIFHNRCRHRGALLAESPCGTARSFVCPYHGWTYGLDGRLRGVSSRGSFSDRALEDRHLAEVVSEERHGFIWVRLQGDEPLNLARYLGPVLDDDLRAFDFVGMHLLRQVETERAANWKLVMDAFAEGYHVPVLHRDSLSRFFESVVLFDDCSPHARHLGARKSLTEMRELPEEQWDLRAHTTLFYNVFPNVVLVFHPTWISQMSLFPVAVNRVHIIHRMLAATPPRDEREKAHFDRSFELIQGQVFEREDLRIAESIQSALSGANEEVFVAGSHERGLAVFHSALQEAIATDAEQE